MIFSDNLVASIKKKLKTPNYFFILMFLVIFFIIYSERIFGIQTDVYHIVTAGLIIFMFIFVILSTMLAKSKISNKSVASFNKLYNNSTCRNMISLFSFLFFVIYIYEGTAFDNNNPEGNLDYLTDGNNNLVSNRLCGIMTIILFSLFTAFGINTN